MDVQGDQSAGEIRRRQILNAVIDAGTAQIDELAAALSVSRMTIHRDIQQLVEQGLVRKVHGGVTSLASSLVESTIFFRSRQEEACKHAIAQRAVSLVEPGQAIVLDDSTTVAALLPFLPALKPLTVISNGLRVIQTLSGEAGVRVISLGGTYVAAHDAFFGLLCEQAAQSLRANVLFMSSSTVHGLTAFHQDQDIVKAKRTLMETVDFRVLLIDSSKFGRTALHRLASLSEFDLVITDSNLPPETREALEASNIRHEIVHARRV